MESPRTCSCTCKKKLFGFSIDESTEKDLITSQWTDRPVVYGLYRSVLSAYTIGVVVYTGVGSVYGVKLLIWFTYWSYYALTAGFLIRALAAWLYVHRLQRKERPSLPQWLLRLQWVMVTLTCTSAPLVSLLFWTLEYKGNDVSFNSGNSHAVNVCLVVLDLFISRYPVRIHHFYVGTCYCFTYSIFTILYWALGGTNHQNRPYIYGILNYGETPALSVGLVFAVSLLAAPFVHCVIYCLYRVRIAVWSLTNKKEKLPVPESMVALKDAVPDMLI